MEKRKLYYDMTARERRVYCAEMLADWIKADFDVSLVVRIPRRVYDADGWHWRGEYCVYDCESNWQPIDLGAFYAAMGIEPKGGYPIDAILRLAGYDARDIGGAVAVLGKRKGNEKAKRR